MKKPNYIFLIICFALVFLIYGPTLGGDFVFDDRQIVSHYSLLSDINKLPQIASMAYWTPETGLYRPVVLISYALNASFFGASPFSFHLVNLILYALTGYLIYYFIRKIFPKRKELSYVTALFFLVLPIHTEVVANITGRGEILALFFSLLVFRELLKTKSSPWKIALWFLLAIGSKETAIVVLPLSFMIVYLKHCGKWSQNLVKSHFSSFAGLFISCLIYFVARFFVLSHNFLSNTATLVENPLKFTSFFERIWTALSVLFIYLKKSFLPFNLCSDYSYNQIPIASNLVNLEAFFGLVFLLSLIFAFVFFLNRRPVLSLAAAFFLFAFLLVSNLIFPIGTIAGERLVYFPSVGLCLFLAFGLVSLSYLNPKKIFRRVAIFILLGLICFYASGSFIRGLDWLNEKSLFISAAQCAPQSVLSRSNMATVYYLEGDYDKAKEELAAAERIYDKYDKAINNLGLVYWKKGEYEKAEKEYFRAIRNWPPYKGVYENLILLYLSQGETEKAKKWARIIFSGDSRAVKTFLKQYGL